MTHPLYELSELIKKKEDELFWARLNPEKVARGETDKLEREIRILKELYWEMV